MKAAGDSGGTELIFLVEEAPEGGLTARALGESIFAEADGLAALHEKVRDAVRCHFDDGQRPAILRLHFVREEVITA
ncbi:MAG TPA: 2-oxoisovalerate dehydrogenase [Candidatus Binatia bacterium]|nr:2-oxoisovalerate dehydrogenase [Candidatus Binatia bacterium]